MAFIQLWCNQYTATTHTSRAHNFRTIYYFRFQNNKIYYNDEFCEKEIHTRKKMKEKGRRKDLELESMTP